MRYYELTLLISPENSEEELNSFQEKIISLIQEEKGILVGTNRKKGKHTLLVLNFQLEPENIEALEKKIKLEGQIFRYLLVVKKPPRVDGIIRRRFLPAKPKQKVEIGEIDKKLEEILGQ